MLKLRCTLPILTNICLHSSAKFYPFIEHDRDLLNEHTEDMIGRPSIVFTRKAIAGETKIRYTENLCKTIVGIDVSQLHPFPCAKKCRLGYTPDGKLMLKRKSLFLFRIGDDFLRTW